MQKESVSHTKQVHKYLHQNFKNGVGGLKESPSEDNTAHLKKASLLILHHQPRWIRLYYMETQMTQIKTASKESDPKCEEI